MLAAMRKMSFQPSMGSRLVQSAMSKMRMVSTSQETTHRDISPISLSSLSDRVSYSLVQERWTPMFKSPSTGRPEGTTSRSEISNAKGFSPSLPDVPLKDTGAPGMSLLQTSRTKVRLHWHSAPRTILIVRKPTDKPHPKLHEMCKWLLTEFLPQGGASLSDVKVLVEPYVANELADLSHLPLYAFDPEEAKTQLSRVVDLIICMGGDGTILHVSSMFNQIERLNRDDPTAFGDFPPVLAFSMGSLSFLSSFNVQDFKRAIEMAFKGGFYCTNRGRLHVCKIGKDLDQQHFQVINEVTFHRSSGGQPITFDFWVDDTFLTSSTGDGLIVGTATGSTGYSLSCGGSMVHPSLDTILLTPICPRSLSFRPLLMPSDVSITVCVAESSRYQGIMSLDGHNNIPLEKGEIVVVRKSPFSVPTINREDNIVDWVEDINYQLKWNQRMIPFKPVVDRSES